MVVLATKRVKRPPHKFAKENSGCCSIRLHIAGDELWNMVERGFRLPKIGFDDVSPFVQRPEGIAEQVRWIVFSFELYESVPVLAKTGFSFACALATAEELEGAVRGHD